MWFSSPRYIKKIWIGVGVFTAVLIAVIIFLISRLMWWNTKETFGMIALSTAAVAVFVFIALLLVKIVTKHMGKGIILKEPIIENRVDFHELCNQALMINNENNPWLVEVHEDEGWIKYSKNSALSIPKGHKVAFRSTATTTGLNGSDKFYCYSPGSDKTARDGVFSIGGNIASLMVGDSFKAHGATLTDWSFQNCFSSHVHLTDASDLVLPMLTCPANGYKNMFKGCTDLTAIPELPATTLGTSCYESMFEGCTSLTSLPVNLLPATSLASYCYKSMFKGCTGLTAAPELPATALVESCYHSMFSGCTGLTKSSVLPAPTLATNCYREMFYNAGALNEVICLATDKSASNCTTNWLYGVAEYGTFWKASGVTWGTGVSAIPTKWVPQDYGIPIFPGDPPFDGEIDL